MILLSFEQIIHAFKNRQQFVLFVIFCLKTQDWLLTSIRQQPTHSLLLRPSMVRRIFWCWTKSRLLTDYAIAIWHDFSFSYSVPHHRAIRAHASCIQIWLSQVFRWVRQRDSCAHEHQQIQGLSAGLSRFSLILWSQNLNRLKLRTNFNFIMN